MDEEANGLIASLRQWDARPASKHGSSVQLIRPQPWRGPSAYLHVLHAGLDGHGIEELEEVYDRKLPPRLIAFYSAMNGASLFEDRLTIYGLVRKFSRDPDVWNPICPSIYVQTFPGLYPRWNSGGFFPIGSLALYSRKARIACHRTDEIIVFEDEGGELLWRYENIFVAVSMLAAKLRPFWHDDGSLIAGMEMLDSMLGTGSA